MVKEKHSSLLEGLFQALLDGKYALRAMGGGDECGSSLAARSTGIVIATVVRSNRTDL